jgi:hypothetical protein
MALVFNTDYVGRAPHATASILFALKECLKAAGWTVRFSGTGTSGTWGAGDLFTLGDVKAIGGIGNPNSWFIIEDPGGRMEFAFRVGSDNTLAGVNFSPLDGFPAVGHSATAYASQSPITDQYTLSSFDNIGSSENTQYVDVVAEDTPLGITYPFWLRAHGVESAFTSYMHFALEALRLDSLQSGDIDNYLIYYRAAGSGLLQSQGCVTTYNAPSANERMYSTVLFYQWGAVDGTVPGQYMDIGRQRFFSPLWIGTDNGNASANTLPMPQMKGVSAYMKYNPYARGNYNNGYFQVGSKAYVPIGELLMPYEPGKLPRKPVT